MKEKHHDQKMNHGSHDHTGHHRMMIKDFRKRFWISLAITAPILVFSPMIQDFLGYTISFKYVNYILFVLSTIVYFYGGWPFLPEWQMN